MHRDLRWPNVIKVVEGDVQTIKLIDLELAGKAGAPCSAHTPLRHWLYDDGRSVLEKDGTYTARSDLKMVGKELLGKLDVKLLDGSGLDLKRKLEDGVYEDARSTLAHTWFPTA